MQIWAYPARIEQCKGGDWVVTFAELPEALTGGATRDEAEALAADALEEAVLAYLAHGQAVPPPRAADEGEVLIALDVVTAARAALARRMADAKISNVALGLRLGKTESAVRRLIDGTTGVKLDTVLVALGAAGPDGAARPPQAALALLTP